MSYKETLSYLFGLQKIGIKFGLANITRLLGMLGNPERGLRCVHIAGTNGKGSTAACIDSIMSQAGFNVGFYTSPHLVDFSERIRTGGGEITEAEVVALTERIREKIMGLPDGDDLQKITFFEFTTAIAFLYFVEKNVDLAVIETGMGGRLDATNTITPLVSVITNISLEHKEFLGETVEAIAGEKAGIIKAGIPVVTGIEQESAFAVTECAAAEKKASLYALGREFSFRRTGYDTFSYRGIRNEIDNIRLNLIGAHQFGNASLSLAAVELLTGSGFKVSEDDILKGLDAVVWPGRIEIVSKSPRIILDGAHNPAGAVVLAKALREELEYDRLYMILGIMADKEVEAIISPLAPLAHELILSRPVYERASGAAALLPAARRYNSNISVFESLTGAISYAKDKVEERDLIVISGSLFTVGEARDILLSGKA